MSKSSSDLRREVEDARNRLAGTVGEIGGVIDDTRNEFVGKAKKIAPIIGGAVGSYVLFRVFRRARR